MSKYRYKNIMDQAILEPVFLELHLQNDVLAYCYILCIYMYIYHNR